MTAYQPASTVVSVTTEGLPGAWADGDHVVLAVTPPLPAAGTQAAIRIPIGDAAAWAAEAYVAVLAAYRNATGHEIPVAAVAHSGRVMITARLADPDPPDPPEAPS